MKLTRKMILKHNPCEAGLRWYDEHGTNSLLSTLLKVNKENPNWASWLYTRLMNVKQRREMAIFAAEQVLPIFEKKYPEDLRPRKAIEAAKAVLENDTPENRKLAYDAADAADAAYAANAANATAYAAYAAYAAANATAYAAANAAAYAAAYAAANAANAAANAAAYAAAYAAANAAANAAAYAAANAAANAADATANDATRLEMQELIIKKAVKILDRDNKE